MLKNSEVYEKINKFHYWCQMVLPLVYDESLSYYEVLCKMMDAMNKMIENQDYFNSIVGPYGETIEGLQKQLDEINEELEKIKAGDYVSFYIEQLANWIDANLQNLVGRIVKQVFFGITKDGYFAAYIPPNWNFLHFDTIVDPGSDLYGHLVLRW